MDLKTSACAPYLHLRLEADNIIECAKRIVAAQLHYGIGFHVRLMRVGKANRLHRAKPQRFATTFGHDLYRQAAVEVFRGFAFVKLGLIRC